MYWVWAVGFVLWFFSKGSSDAISHAEQASTAAQGFAGLLPRALLCSLNAPTVWMRICKAWPWSLSSQPRLCWKYLGRHLFVQGFSIHSLLEEEETSSREKFLNVRLRTKTGHRGSRIYDRSWYCGDFFKKEFVSFIDMKDLQKK